jgi:hypothetical protein
MPEPREHRFPVLGVRMLNSPQSTTRRNRIPIELVLALELELDL